MKILFIVYLSLLLLVFITGLVRFKKAGLPFKILILYLGVTWVQELASRIIAMMVHTNMFVYHITIPIEFLVFTIIYYHYFKGRIKKNLLYFAVPVLLFAAVNSLYIENIHLFPSNFAMLTQIIYCMYALLGFRQMLLQPTRQPLHRQSFFWLNLAVVIFSTTLFIYFGLPNYIVSHKLPYRLIYIFNYIINYVFYTLIGIAIIAETSRPHGSSGKTPINL